MDLRLSLKRQWFEMTKAWIKTEDYRELNEYWLKRLTIFSGKILQLDVNDELIELKNGNQLSSYFAFKPFSTTTLTLGYPSANDKDRIIKFEHKGIEIRTGVEEWGAEPNKLYFVIKHGERIK